MTDIQILHGNCLDVLPTLPDCSVDSIVTDPPYELGFMGKKWDNSGIAYNPDLWQECLRVLKPGGHLLAFGGTRTYHRMAVAIEDAGFEIRDSLHWIYGSGFPKSLDVSKAIDKQAGAEREVVGYGKGVTVASNDNQYGGINRGAVGIKQTAIDVPITAPATDAAIAWSGWGTALKPAHEPIVVARKPLVGTVAGNVLQFGTGAINIDGTRVGYASNADKEKALAGDAFKRRDTSDKGWSRPWMEDQERIDRLNREAKERAQAGRWPANIVFTHNHNCADICTEGCPVAELDRQSGDRPSGGGNKNSGTNRTIYGSKTASIDTATVGGDSGGASRFFTVTEWDAPFRYVAKPGKKERNAGLDHLPAKENAGSYEFRTDGSLDGKTTEPKTNHHPTVKPLALMRWLVRLVTPPNGTVLEPFAGSGTTLVACHLDGFNAIGIEMTDEYLPIIEGRLEWARQQAAEQESDQQELPL